MSGCAEVADPVAGPDEVVIEIHAASLNPIDFKIVHGDLKRVSKYRLPRPFGFDASGVVLSAGARATRFKPGDAVYARASRETIGTFAETDRAAGRNSWRSSRRPSLMRKPRRCRWSG